MLQLFRFSNYKNAELDINFQFEICNLRGIKNIDSSVTLGDFSDRFNSRVYCISELFHLGNN